MIRFRTDFDHDDPRPPRQRSRDGYREAEAKRQSWEKSSKDKVNYGFGFKTTGAADLPIATFRRPTLLREASASRVSRASGDPLARAFNNFSASGLSMCSSASMARRARKSSGDHSASDSISPSTRRRNSKDTFPI